MSARPQVGIIVGSNRPARIAREVADQLVPMIEAAGADAVMLDLKEIDLPFLDEALPPASGVRTLPHTIAWAEQIQSLDGVVFVSPEYNRGYSAVLKNAVDGLKNEWVGKQGGIVAYGWAGGHFAAQQLRDVLEFIGAELAPTAEMAFQPEDFTEQMTVVSVPAIVERNAEAVRATIAEVVARASKQLIAA
ncbi:NADPH-dependent FMN reductase [Agrococcus sp. ARC_14]|uniref:NADPH-dependent FMN reductase n=1 Tax=Agrococcus sp. ARC_14 TaxID=2919927 RepID=UPI001F06B4E8|nr:NADPH-dependent FMN reductase [Agrococcus sp. ARC_14]MCH1881577.1 NAD(P)H-dependent oxidoreductase [Agrococcus sp. ARC_14]